jgi:hypothetical protein
VSKPKLERQGNPFAEAMRLRYAGTSAAGPHRDRLARKRDHERGRSRKCKHVKSRGW